jgi:hypothetical protein
MKILPEETCTPAWNVDWMETAGRRYYSTTDLQGEEKDGNQKGAERGFHQ